MGAELALQVGHKAEIEAMEEATEIVQACQEEVALDEKQVPGQQVDKSQQYLGIITVMAEKMA